MQVSVIVPCHNAATTLGRLQQSLEASREIQWEAVFVNDASTDETAKLLACISSESCRSVTLTQNHGPGYCRNVAIDRTDGDFVAVVDADDWIAPERLNRLVATANSHNLDVVADNQWLCRPDGPSMKKRLPELGQFSIDRGEESPRLLTLSDLVCGSPLGILQPLVRRRFLDQHKIRYRTQHRYGEDFLFLVDLVKCGARFGIVDEPMYFAEVRRESLTADRVAMFSGMAEVLEIVRHELHEDDLYQFDGAIERAIQSCRRTVVYGAVVDPLKQGRLVASVRGLVHNPEFVRQIPSRCVETLSRLVSRFGHRKAL